MIAIASPSPDAATETVTVRFCCHCQQERPIASFRFKNKQRGERHPDCNACHYARCNQRRAVRRDKQIESTIARIANLPERHDAQIVSGILRGVLRRLGGPAKFCDEFSKLILDAPRRSQRLKATRSLLRLIEAEERLKSRAESADLRNIAGAFTKLSDKQLDVLVKLAKIRSL